MLSNEENLVNFISILDKNLPKNITLDIINEESLDLGEELDQFDGEVKEYLEVDELDPLSVDSAKMSILNAIHYAKAQETFERKDLLIYLLEDLSEKLDNL